MEDRMRRGWCTAFEYGIKDRGSEMSGLQSRESIDMFFDNVELMILRDDGIETGLFSHSSQGFLAVELVAGMTSLKCPDDGIAVRIGNGKDGHSTVRESLMFSKGQHSTVSGSKSAVQRKDQLVSKVPDGLKFHDLLLSSRISKNFLYVRGLGHFSSGLKNRAPAGEVQCSVR